MNKILLIATLLISNLLAGAQNRSCGMYGLPDSIDAEESLMEGEDAVADTVVVDTRRLSDIGIKAAVRTAREAYACDWNELSMDGKLVIEDMSIKPSVKIYMKRGESVILSARAPFVGEVARIEMCADSITAINKMKKKYSSVDVSMLTRLHPGFIADVQDILLGNMVFPGYGIVSEELAPRLEWLETDGDVYVYPGDDMQTLGIDYGFLLNPEDYELLAFMLVLPSMEGMLQTSYTYYEKDWTLQLELQFRGAPLGCELQLSYPDYSPSPMQPTDAGARYSRSDLRGLLKF